MSLEFLPSQPFYSAKENRMQTLESLKPAVHAGNYEENATLIDVLRSRARVESQAELYSWLADGESLGTTITCGELDRRARAIAATLVSAGMTTQRALLLYGPGLEYAEAFLGCLYAGVIAVPAGAPRSMRDIPRLDSMVQDSGARCVLSGGDHEKENQRLLTSECWQDIEWIDTDSIESSAAEKYKPFIITKDDIAYVQYTSGSIATPKGVVITHGNLMSNLQSIGASGGFTADSRSLSWLPHFHDMGLIYGFLQPIFSGFPAILFAPNSFVQKPLRWLEAISRYRITHAGGPNFAYDLCVQHIPPQLCTNLDLSCWKVAFNGAEPIRAETIESFTQAFSSCGFRRNAFYPVYGLAEATLKATGPEASEGPVFFDADTIALGRHRAEPADSESGNSRTLVASGRAGLKTEVAIVDPESCNRCGPTEVGEIWIHGPGVAAGYWNRVEESAATFCAVIADDAGKSWLRTGDLGFLREGQLFVTGRRKDCIIIRGQNHYPQDIERTLEQAHPALMGNASIAFSVSGDGEELVVVAELNRHYEGSVDEIAREVRRVISEGHELHAHAVLLVAPGHLPRTSSGKVRRQECRRAFLAGTLPHVCQSVIRKIENGGTDQTHVADSSGVVEAAARCARLESWLLSTTASLLRLPVETLDPDQPLTTFGLDSLAAVQLSHQLDTDLGIQMEPGAALGSSSIRSLAKDLSKVINQKTVTAPVDIGKRIPLSLDQKALWLLQQRADESGALNIARAVRLGSDVDPVRLRECLHQVIKRHPGLHGCITVDRGEPGLEVTNVEGTVETTLIQIDAREWSPDHLDKELTQQSRRTFILHQPPLLRLHLYQLAGGDHLLLIVIHHIVADFWSMSILVAEVVELYAGKSLTPPPGSDSFYKQVAQEQQILAGPQGEKLWQYWRTQLQGELSPPLIPGDRPRLDQSQRESQLHFFEVPASLTASLQEFARNHHSTLYTVLLTAFEVLLHRYTGQNDFILGTPTHGRNSSGLRDVIGYFVKALPLRADLRGIPSFAGLHERVTQTVSGALAHDSMPFAVLNERLGTVRPSGGSSLIDVSFVMQRSRQQGLELVALGHPGATVQVGDFRMQAHPIGNLASTFELIVTMAESGGRLYGSVVYDCAIFDRSTIAQFTQHFIRVMEGAMAEPDSAISTLSLLTDSERMRLVVDWNKTKQKIPSVCVHEMFEAQAEETPTNIALTFGEQDLTYAQLNARANQLAHFLREYGVGPEVPVAICCERGPELVIAIVAVAKAGGMYVPLDATYPAERLAWMLDDSQAPILLTQHKLLEQMPSHWAQVILLDNAWEQIACKSTANPPLLTTPNNSAYVIYTSGSTGQPKGVVVEHRGIVRLVTRMNFWEATDKDTFLMVAPVTFDASTLEIWTPLANGSRLVIAPPNTLSLEEMATIIEQSGITMLFVTSGLFHQLVETQLPRLQGLRYLMTGGDIVSPHHARLVAQGLPGCVLIHAYGPTENTTLTTCHRIESDPGQVSHLPLGKPISNTTVFILDEQMQPVPVGVPGELYTGGIGLARGYLRRPELTAERFLPDPFASEPGQRLYRTGDRVRWSDERNLQFLGRLDHQIKLRGFRIELEEIQAALTQLSGVRQALVLVREDTPGDKRLLAYVAVEPDSPSATAAQLREHLSKQLPDYMVPSAIIVLDDLPLTPTGKIDRKALPAPEYNGEISGIAKARTPVEEILVGIWSDVLKTEHVGINDSFFDLGGHSLLATQLISRARSAFGVELPFRALFESPTVAGFAKRVEESLHQNRKTEISPIVRVSREGPLPLSFAQQRLWFLDQLDPGSTAYNSAGAVRLLGKLDPSAVQRSLTEIVRRHEVLRTTFPVQNGDPVQHIASPGPVDMPLRDLSETQDREQTALQLARDESARPFDLSQGPLLRAALVRLEPEAHLLLLTVHHSICDAWSVNILIREFTTLYAALLSGEVSPLAELPIQYADFAIWQRQWLTGDVLERYLTYWRDKLAGMPSLQLRIGRGRSEMRAAQGKNDSFELQPDVITLLKELSRRQGSTLFMTMLTAFEILMHRYSGQSDFAVGAPIAGRNRVEIEDLIGFFVNMVPLRADLSGDPTFEELLQRVRTTTLEAHSHQALPLEKLIEEVKPPRINGRPQIFQVTFELQNEEMALRLLPGGDASLIETGEETIRFGLVLRVSPTATGFRARWTYDNGVFDSEEIERLNWDYSEILRQITEHPGARVSELAGPVLEPEATGSISDRTGAENHADRMSFVARKRNAVHFQ
jgi:amino acid adenylation domain-containing protein